MLLRKYQLRLWPELNFSDEESTSLRFEEKRLVVRFGPKRFLDGRFLRGDGRSSCRASDGGLGQAALPLLTRYGYCSASRCCLFLGLAEGFFNGGGDALPHEAFGDDLSFRVDEPDGRNASDAVSSADFFVVFRFADVSLTIV